MGPLKVYLMRILLLLFLLTVPTSASAFPQYKVALLPVINTADLKTTEVADLLQHKVHRKLRFPFYEFVADTEITQALTALPTKNGALLPTQANLALISQQLSADIVVVTEVVRAGVQVHHHFSLWNDETFETSDVLLKCYTYSNTDHQYYVVTAGKYNSAPSYGNSGVLAATAPLVDELVKKIPFATIPSQE